MLRPTDDADGAGRWCADAGGLVRTPDPTWASPRRPSLSLRPRVSYDPLTRAHARLLGPCFKTGRVECRRRRHRPTQIRPGRPLGEPGTNVTDTGGHPSLGLAGRAHAAVTWARWFLGPRGGRQIPLEL